MPQQARCISIARDWQGKHGTQQVCEALRQVGQELGTEAPSLSGMTGSLQQRISYLYRKLTFLLVISFSFKDQTEAQGDPDTWVLQLGTECSSRLRIPATL